MLNDKTILITGANGSLGRVTVASAIEAGASVIGVDRAFDQTSSAMQKLAVDLTDAGATQEALGDIGPIDAVFNIAGGFSMGPSVHERDSDEWTRLHEMNCGDLVEHRRGHHPRYARARRGQDCQRRRTVSARRASGDERLLCDKKHRHADHRIDVARAARAWHQRECGVTEHHRYTG